MPIYDYRCLDCHKTCELLVKLSNRSQLPVLRERESGKTGDCARCAWTERRHGFPRARSGRARGAFQQLPGSGEAAFVKHSKFTAR